MNRIKTSEIWRKLLLNGSRITTTEELGALAGKLGKDPRDAVRYLQREGYLKRIFRGIFYVVPAHEMATGRAEYTLYEMIASGLEAKGAAPWYFGLESGLKLNGMTHEFFNIDQVISGSWKTTRAIRVQGMPVRVNKWSKDLFIPGSIISRPTKHDVNILFSNKEKTVLDLAYKRYLDGGSASYVQGAVLNYQEQLLEGRVMEYLSSYPGRFRNMVVDIYG